MGACGTRICRATIAEFMHVEPMVAGSKACYLCTNLHSIGNFGEGNRAAQLVACCGMKQGNRS